MEYTGQRGKSTRTSSPPASYPGHARPYTRDTGSGDRVRTRAERPASGSSDRKPEAAANRHSKKSPKVSSNLDEINDLRKLVHIASELQKIDLETALNLYKGFMKKTNNDELMKAEETYLEQLTSEGNISVRTELEEQIEALSRENEELKREKTSLEKVRQQSKGLFEEVQRMKTESEKHKADLKRKEEKFQKLKEEKDAVIAEKNEALTRLSKEMGTTLSDKTPAIAHLNDPNRPMKLGEKYNELFDNEWTDAIEKLCENEQDERANIQKLLDILKKCYTICTELSEKQMTTLQMTLEMPVASCVKARTTQCMGEALNPQTPKSICKQLKVCQREMSHYAVDNIYKEHASDKIGYVTKTIPNFVKKCIELCWLMCVQEPPVVLGEEATVAETFDTNMYKPYTNSGTVVSYNVWPPLILHENGAVLVKGVVQPVKVGRKKGKGHVGLNGMKATAAAKPRTDYSTTHSVAPVVNTTGRSGYDPDEDAYGRLETERKMKAQRTDTSWRDHSPALDYSKTSHNSPYSKVTAYDMDYKYRSNGRDHVESKSTHVQNQDYQTTRPSGNYDQKPVTPYAGHKLVQHKGVTYIQIGEVLRQESNA